MDEANLRLEPQHLASRFDEMAPHPHAFGIDSFESHMDRVPFAVTRRVRDDGSHPAGLALRSLSVRVVLEKRDLHRRRQS
jgi:hypothetical protein